MRRAAFSLLAAVLLSAGPALAEAAAPVPCGGPLPAFLKAFEARAVAQGHDAAAVRAFFRGARIDPKVLAADGAQGVFRKTFLQFSSALISRSRVVGGERNARRYAAIFARAKRDYGVPKGILLAFWAFETDFGAVQGNFNTRDALLTLAHDCRRPQVFQPQLMAAITLYEKGEFNPQTTTGAWAGEIGQVQMLPRDILERGVDGDGDGKVTLKTSVPDALLSAAHTLQMLGWRANQPWMVEVRVPKDLDWARTGLNTRLPARQWAAMGVRARQGQLPGGDLPASILLPQGRKGPAFMVFPNFDVLFHWNKSFVYVTTVAYFADLMEGAPRLDPGHPDPQLDLAQMKALQRKLQARGYDVGKVDGILGRKTRTAVQKEQKRLNLPADAWPTLGLLKRL
ncbi:lytic transglycosylase [Defluviimonas sp. 20V17]|uniref:Lytic murein transglycosylase n=1 Tax=Allgaiera indica TaxID=765699 RepID=A0AAN4UNC1_9RHOB|nr:lytic murein transglycosylase [Allgaiera indica]KDB01815.1 lytic transglycosylase [Defluviimonas sp. 20V17]GHD98920.1 lytic transglycosylase [Allgaiera indica]SDW03451.1 lytic murein transglycosylase [Allgaiera indica]